MITQRYCPPPSHTSPSFQPAPTFACLIPSHPTVLPLELPLSTSSQRSAIYAVSWLHSLNLVRVWKDMIWYFLALFISTTALIIIDLFFFFFWLFQSCPLITTQADFLDLRFLSVIKNPCQFSWKRVLSLLHLNSPDPSAQAQGVQWRGVRAPPFTPPCPLPWFQLLWGGAVRRRQESCQGFPWVSGPSWGSSLGYCWRHWVILASFFKTLLALSKDVASSGASSPTV